MPPDPEEATWQFLFQPTPIDPPTLSVALSTLVSQLMASPMPTPRFVGQVKPEPGIEATTSDRIFVSIWEAGIWEPGDTWKDVENRIIEGLRLTVNGSTIQFHANDLIGISLVGFSLPRPGTLVANQGNTFDVPFPTKMQPGLYVVTVEIPSKNGPAHSFTWAFRIQ